MELAIEMVRKGGTALNMGDVHLGTKITIDTTRLHYDEITIKGSYNTAHEMEAAFNLLSTGVISVEDYISRHIH